MTDPKPTVETLLAHGDWVRHLARRLVADPAEADDVAQDAWLEVLSRPPRHGGNLRSWLSTVVRRMIGRRYSHPVNRSLEAGDAVGDEDLIDRLQLHRKLVGRVLDLAPHARRVVLLRFFEGLPPRDIARRLGVPVETVRTRLRRALHQLRGEIERDGGDGRAGPALLAIAGLHSTWPEKLVPAGSAAAAKGALAGGMMVSLTTKIGAGAVAAVALIAAVWSAQELGGADELEPVRKAEETGDPTRPRRYEGEETHGPSPAAPGEEPAAAPLDSLPPEAPAPRLSGIVVDAQGRPVPDAELFLDAHQSYVTRDLDAFAAMICARRNAGSGGMADHYRRMLKETRSGVDGRFELELSEKGGTVAVGAHHPEHGLACIRGIKVPAGVSPPPVHIVLAGGVVLHGRVTDRSGRAMPNATVAIGVIADEVLSAAGDVSTDEDGVYETPPMPYDRFRVSAKRDGWFTATSRVFTVPSGAKRHRLDFELDESPVIGGRLVDASGRPAGLAAAIERLAPSRNVDAYLRQFPATVRPASRDPRQGKDYARWLQSRGKLVLDDDRYELRREHTYESWVAICFGEVVLGAAEIEDGAAPDIVVDVGDLPIPDPVSTITIRAVDAGTGEPVKDYRVRYGRLENPVDARPRRGRLDRVEADDGIHVLRDQVVGEYVIVIQAAGYADLRRRLVLESTAPARIDARLRAGTASISGTVRDPGGAPVADVDVALIADDGGPEFPAVWRGRSDAEGGFVAGHLAPGRYHAIVAEAPGYAAARAVVDAAPRGEVCVWLRPGVEVLIAPRPDVSSSLSIRVLDGEGLPVIDDAFAGRRSLGGSRRVRLQRGRYVVDLRCSGFGTTRAPFTAAPGAEVFVELERRGAEGERR